MCWAVRQSVGVDHIVLQRTPLTDTPWKKRTQDANFLLRSVIEFYPNRQIDRRWLYGFIFDLLTLLFSIILYRTLAISWNIILTKFESRARSSSLSSVRSRESGGPSFDKERAMRVTHSTR